MKIKLALGALAAAVVLSACGGSKESDTTIVEPAAPPADTMPAPETTPPEMAPPADGTVPADPNATTPPPAETPPQQ